jgi:hypothetical protein
MEIKINCSYSKMENIYSVIPNPRNPNRHPDDQIKRLAEIIKFTGFRSPIVISSRSGFVVKGHGRLMAANLLKMEYVPVDIQDYESEAQEFSDMIADNRIAELSEIDNAALSELLGELPEIDFTGFTDFEIEKIFQSASDYELLKNIKASDDILNPAIKRQENKWEPGNIVVVTISGADHVLTDAHVSDLRTTWSSAGAKVEISTK